MNASFFGSFTLTFQTTLSMNPKKRTTPSERNLFQLCFPCFGKPSVDCDEMMFKSFGREFTEYEYVIENLAIRRAPKVLLDSYQPPPKIKSKYGQTRKPTVKNFGVTVTKKAPPEVAAGPIVEATDAPPEDTHLFPLIENRDKKVCGPCNPHIPGFNPCYMNALHSNLPCKPCKIRADGDKIAINENVLNKTLVPPVYRVEVPKIQVSADIHRDRGVNDHPKREEKNIPTEIQQTIDALRLAKPTHLTALPRKHHRNLMRSVSDTSCDKETFCNFLGLDNFKEETSEETRSSRMNIFYPENRRKVFARSTQLRKRSVSPKKIDDNKKKAAPPEKNTSQ